MTRHAGISSSGHTQSDNGNSKDIFNVQGCHELRQLDATACGAMSQHDKIVFRYLVSLLRLMSLTSSQVHSLHFHSRRSTAPLKPPKRGIHAA
eukprot:2808137-Amphidinium_carterae.2